MGGYEVDPASLAESGKTVGAQGDALSKALGALDSALADSGLMCGTDAAGLAFFIDYRKGGQAVISAAESAVNAFRNVGYGVEVSAHNYAISDAASTVNGGHEAIPVPAEPPKFTASGISGQSGPEIPQPSLWSLVEPFINRAWPNGNPGTMREVATAWRALGTAISTASGDARDCSSSISGHEIPESGHITDALNTLTSGATELAGKCTSIAEKLESFAGEVQSSQDSIRDLLHRVSASGILGQIGKIVTGHNPIDDLKQIGHDISEILHTLSRELDAASSAFDMLIDGMDGLVRDFEDWERKEFTRFFGDQVGNVMANNVNAYLDINEGVAKSLLETVESVPAMLAHPGDTAKGIWELDKNMAEFLNPLGPIVDPAGQKEAREHLLETVKGVVDYEDWSSDRPLVGLGDNIGNIAQVLIPGAGEAKAGITAGKVGEDAAQIARAEGKVARGGLEALGETSGKQIADQAGKVGKDLDGLASNPVEAPKAPEPVARPGESASAPVAKPLEEGAAGGNGGAGKAPVDAGARPGGESAPAQHTPAASPHVGEAPAASTPHGGGAEPPASTAGRGEPVTGSAHGNGETSPVPAHTAAGEPAPSSVAAHEGSAASSTPPPTPTHAEMSEAHSRAQHGGEPARSSVSEETHAARSDGDALRSSPAGELTRGEPHFAEHETSDAGSHLNDPSHAMRDGDSAERGYPPNSHGPDENLNNPPHTGLYDPPLNGGIAGDSLPDLTEINQEYRLPNGEVDPDRLGDWAQKVSDEYPSLTKDGVEGVYDYTTENYDGMNPYLRNIDPLNAAQQQILDAHAIDQLTDAQKASWEARIVHTDEGLSGLPPYREDPADPTSTTWRGMRATDSLLDQFIEGRTFSDPAYLSTSTDSRVAEEFARGAGENQTPTLLQVEGYDGVDVRQLSRYMQESEILFPRGAQFEVVSRILGDDGILRIILKQALR